MTAESRWKTTPGGRKVRSKVITMPEHGFVCLLIAGNGREIGWVGCSTSSSAQAAIFTHETFAASAGDAVVTALSRGDRWAGDFRAWLTVPDEARDRRPSEMNEAESEQRNTDTADSAAHPKPHDPFDFPD